MMEEITMQLSIEERDILEHSLGLNRSKKMYRNYFSVDVGNSEYQGIIDRLVASGLMIKGKKSDHLQFYHVTEKGKIEVL